MALPSFIFNAGFFGQNPGGMTWEEMKRRQALADEFASRRGRATDIGTGIGDMMQGLALGIMRKRASSGMQTQLADLQRLIGGGGGMGLDYYPPAPIATDAPTAPVPSDENEGSMDAAMGRGTRKTPYYTGPYSGDPGVTRPPVADQEPNQLGTPEAPQPTIDSPYNNVAQNGFVEYPELAGMTASAGNDWQGLNQMKQIRNISLTPQDRDTMIRTIVGEASNQDMEGQAAVANSIFNRVFDPRWPDTAHGVARQPNQYSTWLPKKRGGNREYISSLSPNSKAYQTAAAALDYALANPDNTFGSTHYYSPSGMEAYRKRGLQNHLVPGWWNEEVARRGGNAVRIGGHLFAGKSSGYDGPAGPAYNPEDEAQIAQGSPPDWGPSRGGSPVSLARSFREDEEDFRRDIATRLMDQAGDAVVASGDTNFREMPEVRGIVAGGTPETDAQALAAAEADEEARRIGLVPPPKSNLMQFLSGVIPNPFETRRVMKPGVGIDPTAGVPYPYPRQTGWITDPPPVGPGTVPPGALPGQPQGPMPAGPTMVAGRRETPGALPGLIPPSPHDQGWTPSFDQLQAENVTLTPPVDIWGGIPANARGEPFDGPDPRAAPPVPPGVVAMDDPRAAELQAAMQADPLAGSRHPAQAQAGSVPPVDIHNVPLQQMAPPQADLLAGSRHPAQAQAGSVLPVDIHNVPPQQMAPPQAPYEPLVAGRPEVEDPTGLPALPVTVNAETGEEVKKPVEDAGEAEVEVKPEDKKGTDAKDIFKKFLDANPEAKSSGQLQRAFQNGGGILDAILGRVTPASQNLPGQFPPAPPPPEGVTADAPYLPPNSSAGLNPNVPTFTEAMGENAPAGAEYIPAPQELGAPSLDNPPVNPAAQAMLQRNQSAQQTAIAQNYNRLMQIVTHHAFPGLPKAQQAQLMFEFQRAQKMMYPDPMTPYQRAQLDLNERKFAHEQAQDAKGDGDVTRFRINPDTNAVEYYQGPQSGWVEGEGGVVGVSELSRGQDAVLADTGHGLAIEPIPQGKLWKEERAEEAAKLKQKEGKGTSTFIYQEAADTALRIIDKQSEKATGLPTYFTEWVRGGGATALSAALDPMRGQNAFETLAHMRASNPNGAGLGQISNLEIGLLQATKGSLDNLEQPPGQLAKNVFLAAKVQEAVQNGDWWRKLPEGYKLISVQKSGDPNDPTMGTFTYVNDKGEVKKSSISDLFDEEAMNRDLAEFKREAQELEMRYSTLPVYPDDPDPEKRLKFSTTLVADTDKYAAEASNALHAAEAMREGRRIAASDEGRSYTRGGAPTPSPLHRYRKGVIMKSKDGTKTWRFLGDGQEDAENPDMWELIQ